MRTNSVEEAAPKSSMGGRAGYGHLAWPIIYVVLLMCVSNRGNGAGGTGTGAGAAAAASEDHVLATVNAVRREGVDSSLRKYAVLAVSDLEQPDAARGKVYNVTLTPVLQGIESQALRLATGSTLQQHGLTFNEISIPQGADLMNIGGDGMQSSSHPAADADADVAARPLLLIYRKIVNFTVYSLPASFSFAGPVVGIIAYAPSNFTTDDPALPQLLISFSGPLQITTTLPLSISSAPSTSISCAFFSRNGSVSFTPTASSPTICISDTLQDVALVLPTQDLPQHQQQQQQQQQQQTASDGSSTHAYRLKHKAAGSKHSWKLALGATCLALAGFGFCVAFAVASIGVVRRLKVVILARLTGNEEALQTSLIGVSRPPSAPAVRTKPALEMDVARFD